MIQNIIIRGLSHQGNVVRHLQGFFLLAELMFRLPRLSIFGWWSSETKSTQKDRNLLELINPDD